MATHILKGAEGLQKALAGIAAKMGAGAVSVGFMAGATYPDGTPVAAVAFWNEFGGPGRPPRPFFRQMIAAESPTWGAKIGKLAVATKYDGPAVLAMMGEDIAGALGESISNFETPALAESTVAAKGFAKPLIDTGDMQRAITYKVED